MARTTTFLSTLSAVKSSSLTWHGLCREKRVVGCGRADVSVSPSTDCKPAGRPPSQATWATDNRFLWAQALCECQRHTTQTAGIDLQPQRWRFHTLKSGSRFSVELLLNFPKKCWTQKPLNSPEKSKVTRDVGVCMWKFLRDYAASKIQLPVYTLWTELSVKEHIWIHSSKVSEDQQHAMLAFPKVFNKPNIFHNIKKLTF